MAKRRWLRKRFRLRRAYDFITDTWKWIPFHKESLKAKRVINRFIRQHS